MSKRTPKIVANVCLYGNHEIGAGWLAELADGAGKLGDGEPVQGRSFTTAVIFAVGAVREALRKAGRYAKRVRYADRVRVFSPDGQRVAEVGIASVPLYGDLVWSPAPQYVIDAAAIAAAAEPTIAVGNGPATRRVSVDQFILAWCTEANRNGRHAAAAAAFRAVLEERTDLPPAARELLEGSALVQEEIAAAAEVEARYQSERVPDPDDAGTRRPGVRFDPADCGGAFDGFSVSSDADPGL